MATGAIGQGDAVHAIRAMDEEFCENLRNKDAERLVEAFYADDARVLAPGSPAMTGKAAIREFWQGVAGAVTNLELDTTHIEVSGDLAYGVGEYTMRFAQPGDGPPTQHGKYVVVYRHCGQRWRAVADMFSSNE